MFIFSHQIARVGRKSVSQAGRTLRSSQTGEVELWVCSRLNRMKVYPSFTSFRFISPVIFFKAFKIGSSWWTMSWGVVRKNATMKMNRLATSFFRFTHCLLSERFSQMMSFGGGAYLWTEFQKSLPTAIFTRLSIYRALWQLLIGAAWTLEENWTSVSWERKWSHLKLSMEFLWSLSTVRAWLMFWKVTNAWENR